MSWTTSVSTRTWTSICWRCWLAVLAAPAGAVLAKLAVPANARGYWEALRFVEEHADGERAWAVEGAGHYGAGLSRFLAGRGVFAAVSCAILLVMAAAILARVGEGPLKRAPGKLGTALSWFTTIYSALAVVLNLATQSSSERAVFAPTAVLLFVLVVTTMVGSRRTS